MMRYRTVRVLLAFLFSVGLCSVDFFMQTRSPREGVQSGFEDSWWYRAWNYTVPPEGQRGIGFVIYTAACVLAATIIFYIFLSRWQRRGTSKASDLTNR
jgi:hypothetical protein